MGQTKPILTLNRKLLKQMQDRAAQVRAVGERLGAANSKYAAAGFIQTFQKGLIGNDLGLKQLVDITIAHKKAMGYSAPKKPLYGEGKSNPNSYYNMFFIRKTKGGYSATPRTARHHTSSLRLCDLYQVHEYGSVIHTKYATIRIPARPAGKLSYRRFMGSKQAGANVRAAMNSVKVFIKTGKLDDANKFIKEANRAVSKYEKAS
jgi:hypothetical protein